MSEGSRFVVEVIGTLKEPAEVTITRVSEALGLDAKRAGSLVARMPGVITKPVGEGRAMKIALRLQQSGVPALHRPLADHEDPFKTGEVPAVVVPVAVADPLPRSLADLPSMDATHHDAEPDPKLTPMSEAGFATAADIMIPTNPTDTPPRPQPSFVASGPTSEPRPSVDDPVVTMVRPPGASPTPAAGGRSPTPLPEGAPRRRSAPGAGAPVYRQTRSSAEPPLVFSPPPDEALARGGVAAADLPGRAQRRRGRLGRHLAAQVALPGLLTWSLTAVALWWFLSQADQTDLFVPLAAATAVAALIGALLAALGTQGVARDVVRLRDEARRVAMGELTSPVASNRDDELGELAGSLEKTRLSLQEGMERLRTRKR